MTVLSDIWDKVKDVGSSALEATGLKAKAVAPTDVVGVGTIGQDAPGVANEYQRRLQADAAARQGYRRAEGDQLDDQRRRILGGFQPNFAASTAAYQQAAGAGQASLGAARSAGAQTSALGALGAGQSAQYGNQAAAGVMAADVQRNALAQAQYAEMLRNQDMARIGIERGDAAQMLGNNRGLLTQGLEQQQQSAAAEADRAQKRMAAAYAATSSGLAQLGSDKK